MLETQTILHNQTSISCGRDLKFMIPYKHQPSDTNNDINRPLISLGLSHGWCLYGIYGCGKFLTGT